MGRPLQVEGLSYRLYKIIALFLINSIIMLIWSTGHPHRQAGGSRRQLGRAPAAVLPTLSATGQYAG